MIKFLNVKTEFRWQAARVLGFSKFRSTFCYHDAFTYLALNLVPETDITVEIKIIRRTFTVWTLITKRKGKVNVTKEGAQHPECPWE